MEDSIFVNDAINEAIKKYIECKDKPENENFDSFLVIVIRALILIYGELDIMNPYRTHNEISLGGFDANLKKFGLSQDLVDEFKQQCLIFYQNENNLTEEKTSFLKIQEILIDMLVMKKKHVFISDDEIKEFQNLLYFAEDSNAKKLELYNKLTPNSKEIMNYLSSQLFSLNHNFNLREYKDIVLDKEAYQLAGYNIVEVMNMKEDEILNINNKVYHFFRIKETDKNKEKRLASAILYYKKYGNALTSGNGYVDTLLLASVVATAFLVIILIAINLAR